MNQEFDVAAQTATAVWARRGGESSACLQSGLVLWEYRVLLGSRKEINWNVFKGGA